MTNEALPRQKILIVDDVTENIKVLANLLKGEADIIFANDGAQALERAASLEPDLILLDILMPEMDGYEVCKQLKSDEQTQDIPVVFVTARTDEESEAQGLSLGAIDYIVKPFNPAIVLARVRNHLAYQHATEQLKNANEELTRLASIDFLTGVYNRRRFMELAEQELSRVKRTERSFGVIMADIDKFKAVNDTHGHDAGDRVLVAMAGACVNLLRDVDVVGRLGGEEFAMILPETDLAGTGLVAERMRAHLENLVVRIGDLQLSFTISAGYTAIDDGSDSIDDALKRADEALYQAKETGRNRVVDHSDVPPEKD